MIALISLVRWRSLMTYFNDTYDDYIVLDDINLTTNNEVENASRTRDSTLVQSCT